MSSEFQLGSWVVRPSQNAVSLNGKTTRLEPKMVEVLVCLAEHPGETVSKDQLLRRVWGDTFVTEDVLTRCVSELRRVLEDDPKDAHVIQTIPRKGYRLVPPVTPLTPVKKKTSRSYWIVAIVLAALLTVAIAYGRFRHPPSAIHSLAVLPLKNLSGDATQEYLADGMTEALIGRLSGIHDLRVISRTSVMHFKDTQLSVPEIARALGVDAIVEGSVIRDGGRIRVNAQLIRGATDEHIWSEAYDRELRDVLTLESEVAQSIAQRVAVTVTGEERTRLVAARHVSPEVYESYLKGEFAKSDSKAEIEESIAYFEQAIAKDPSFAPAYVGLAEAYDNLGTVVIGGSPSEMRPKVISAAQKALELDPQLAEAHVVLAGMHRKQWQWAEAETEYRRALALNPNDPSAHLGLAMWLMCHGRMDESLAWARRARELDPLGVSGGSIGWILFQSRHYDESIRELRSVLAVHPDEADVYSSLGFALIGNGQPGEAIPLIEKAASLMDRAPGAIGLLATAYARAGRRGDALRLIGELKQRQKTGYVPAGAFINPYLALGDYDQAFVWFDRAAQEQSNIMQFVKVHPFFDPVRSDPRFAALVQRVGLD